MRKLVVVLLLVTASCRRAPPPGEPMGAPTARDAVNQFMATVRSQDLDAMGRIWGSKAGPAIVTVERSQREQREVVMIRCLKHDQFAVLSETSGSGGERHFNVELRYKQLVAATIFVATPGPGERWYLERIAMEGMQQLCVAL